MSITEQRERLRRARAELEPLVKSDPRINAILNQLVIIESEKHMNETVIEKENERLLVQGYRDGIQGFQAASLHPWYQRGWENGIADRTVSPDDEQRARARTFIENGWK